MPVPETVLASNFQQWCDPHYPRRAGLVQVEGAEAVRWLLRSALHIVAVAGKASTLTSLQPEIAQLPADQVLRYSRADLADLAGFAFDRGVLAVAQRPPQRQVNDLLQAPCSGLRLLICDAVHDATNVGVMIRSARCLGLNGVIMGPGSADPWSRRCIRVGVGHPLCLPIYHSADLVGDLKQLAQAGVSLIAAHRGPCSLALEDMDPLTGPWAVVVGNEDRGPHPEVVATCAQHRHISMHDATDSLNVATAATVFMHHLRSCETPLHPGQG